MIGSGPQNWQSLGNIDASVPVAAREVLPIVTHAEVEHAPLVVAKWYGENIDLSILYRESALEIERFVTGPITGC